MLEKVNLYNIYSIISNIYNVPFKRYQSSRNNYLKKSKLGVLYNSCKLYK